MIREVLDQTDGKNVVANMATEEDIAWLLELREKVCAFGIPPENLKIL